MKAPRIIYLTLAGLSVVVILLTFLVVNREPRRPKFTNPTKLMAALQAFTRAQVTMGRRVPDEVSLTNLITGGYFSASDVAGLEGMKDLTFSTLRDDNAAPPFLAWARTLDGQYVCLVSDGSAQIYSVSKFQQAMQAFRQRAAATNSSQPPIAETNTSGLPRH